MRKQFLEKQTIEQGTLAHFINKYYQTRKRAKESRYFLHLKNKQELKTSEEKYNKYEWHTKSNLLIPCQQKTKQKKNEEHFHIASILQISEEALKNNLNISEEALKNNLNNSFIQDFFKKIKGFKTTCDKAATAQKEHRGELKILLNKVSTKEESSLSTEEKNLKELKKKCKELSKELAEKLKIEEQKAKKFESVFSFAQINNIIFEDRNGFSKSCPICNCDDAFRMREEKNISTKASRLIAMKMKVIDGAIKKIFNVLSSQIVKQKWQTVEKELQEDKKISIPLIVEQNQFEFEPNLKKLKNKPLKSLKEASKKEEFKIYNNICAYTGEEINNGEWDHIIPRSSKYGILNDRANLIYVSEIGNKKKKERTYTLANLNKEYKNKTFKLSNDNEIKDFIYKTLLGKTFQGGQSLTEEEKSKLNFSFGNYLSFTNLNADEQKAFQHALFLDSNDFLRKKTIETINNMKRTIVNGTQRYFAQCIADGLYQKAKQIKKENNIEFDFFQISSDIKKPDSVRFLRDSLSRKDEKYKKKENQKPHSHIIDAQMAFLIAAHKHQNEGSMKITFPKMEIDSPNGVNRINKNIFDDIDTANHTYIEESEKNEIDCKAISTNEKIEHFLKKKKSNHKNLNLARMFSKFLSKENAMGERFKPIFKYENKFYIGFPQKLKANRYDIETYSNELEKKNDKETIKQILEENRYYECTTNNDQITIYNIKKENQNGKTFKLIYSDAQKYFSTVGKVLEDYTEEEQKKIKQLLFIFNNCQYYIKKESLINAPKILNQKNQMKYPFYKKWEQFNNEFIKDYKKNFAKEPETKNNCYINENAINKFAKEWLKINEKEKRNHQKVRKNFSMNAEGIPSGSLVRINRRGKNIFQLTPLENKRIAGDYTNFLTKNSRNLTNIVKKNFNKFMEEISKEKINPLNQKLREVKDKTINPTDFFKKDFLEKHKDFNIKVILSSKTTIQITLPSGLFKGLTVERPEGTDHDNDTLKINKTDLKKIGLAENKEWLLKLRNSYFPTDRNDPLKDITSEKNMVSFSICFRTKVILEWIKCKKIKI